MPILAQLGKKPARLKMIEQALQDKNPPMYQQLKKSGKLQEFLDNQEEGMMESYEEASAEEEHQILRKNPPPGYQETVQQLNMAQNECWHEAMQNWLEFPTTESNPETSTEQEDGSE